MTRFYPIYVRRSDASLEVQTRTGKQKNEPSPEQLDRTPDAKGICDYYREIGPDEVKHMDWRRKLAGMLLREIGGSEYADRATNSILHEFPENYRLYEHIKSRTDGDGTKSHKSKNHSGGGHDRQDAYLYGHPMGPKKRFRSPADYFPHLLWLVSDQAGDSNNCSCKICCPEELEADKTATAAAAAKETKAPAATPVIKKEETPSNTTSTGRYAVVEIPRHPTSSTPQTASKPSTPILTPTQRANTAIQRTNTPQALVPSPLPQPRSIDQQLDSQYAKFIFRPGELVWFNKGTAWGLGVIVRRYLQSDMRCYIIQPLSHPFRTPATATITQEVDIRPWLAWSAPPCTFSYLQNHPIPYDHVDWEGLLNYKYGNNGDPEVDASILAAKMVDTTYTVFGLLRKGTHPSGYEESHWNGIYLGGEKIWCGEPVRLRLGSGSDIMVITDILERKAPTPPPSALSPTADRYDAFLVGDIYTFRTADVLNPSAPPNLPSNTYLPPRMRQDLTWRNNSTISSLRSIGFWNLVSVQTRLEISEIKGRWYESSILFPIIHDPATFEKALSRGEISDIGTWINARGDSSNLPKAPGERKADRVEAFGQAVPVGMRIVDGIDPPPMPQQQQHVMSLGMDQAPEPVLDPGLMPEGTLDDYLNLDGMDADSLPGFGSTYGSQGDGHGFFG
ncbi:hypothetical protein K432DRAFT_334858 [Lepidopterella palustris CBS 459.81]|uniref:Cryptic loci regulator 2 N-terminal domain-containing protein n=1 Tax=Lepidopterella palustris CBS 459.81 TaxID=1314670 RepID=A0A8E2E3S5_9PEZI|nr:hypothetical protein K432DRAFT_334858 [Lepidopterella palustris CBS 459.81]